METWTAYSCGTIYNRCIGGQPMREWWVGITDDKGNDRTIAYIQVEDNEKGRERLSLMVASIKMQEALLAQNNVSFSVQAHDMGSLVSHRWAGDGEATGCRACIADAKRKSALEECVKYQTE